MMMKINQMIMIVEMMTLALATIIVIIHYIKKLFVSANCVNEKGEIRMREKKKKRNKSTFIEGP